MNEVFISGKIKSAERRQNDAIELTVEVVRSGGNDNMRTDLFNILFTGEQKTLESYLSSSTSKTTYISLSGLLVERSLNKEGEDRNSQVYILGTQLHSIGTVCDSQRAFGLLSGDVMYRNFQYTQNGTPRLRYIVRNRRVSKDKERSTGIFVTTFKEESDVQFEKGDVIVVSGRLESVEKQPGVYSCEMVAFDVFTTDSRSAPLLAPPKVASSPINLDLDLNDDITTEGKKGLPF